MKTVAVITCFILLLGCSKENTEHGLAELNGKWELRISDGGFSYAHKTYPAGNGDVYTFSGSNQYRKDYTISGENNTISGTYSVTGGTTCDNKQVNFIRFADVEPFNTSIVSVANDSLYIKVNGCAVADGVDFTYVKIN